MRDDDHHARLRDARVLDGEYTPTWCLILVLTIVASMTIFVLLILWTFIQAAHF